MKLTCIDLFAGAGGLSIGIKRAGFELIAATDFDHWCCESLRSNHPDIYILEKDIIDTDLEDFEKRLFGRSVDLIVGGPPCQGFSQLGKRLKNDPRNQLWKQYMRFVKHFRPMVFLMENVPQILKSEEFHQVKVEAERLGYAIKERILHAVDYGVPQRRKRAVIIGSRIGEFTFPDATHAEKGKKNLFSNHLENWRTVRDAIGDLPLIPNNKDLHIGRNPTAMSIERYKVVPPGGNRFNLPLKLTPECWRRKKTGSTDVFGRLEWDKPSLTIRTEFFKPEKGRYLHPEAHRPITIREAARLQTFPADYKFVGSNVQIAKQIGNAVPVLLAEAVGKAILYTINTFLQGRLQPRSFTGKDGVEKSVTEIVAEDMLMLSGKPQEEGRGKAPGKTGEGQAASDASGAGKRNQTDFDVDPEEIPF